MNVSVAKNIIVKLIVPSGCATPQPPVGPALGARGVKSIDFCKQFNEMTTHFIQGIPIPVVISILPDRSFTFQIKSPPTSWLLFKAAKVDKGSPLPGKTVVGTVSLKHIYEIAKIKHKDENIQRIPLESVPSPRFCLEGSSQDSFTCLNGVSRVSSSGEASKVPLSTVQSHPDIHSSSKEMFSNDGQSGSRMYGVGGHFKRSRNLAGISWFFFKRSTSHTNHSLANGSLKSFSKDEEEKKCDVKGSQTSHSFLDLKHFFKSHHHDRSQLNGSDSLQKKKHSLLKLKFRKLENSFKDDHSDFSHKYEKYGKPVGSGTGGSVRLLTTCDGAVYAVKEFRQRAPYESDREYRKKVSAEFCVGAALHHPNIIRTLDFIADGSKFYEIMEYVPYDIRLLPRETRFTIQGMLEIDSKDRWTMEQITQQSWIKLSEMCYIDGKGVTIKAMNHDHTLELEKMD
ncbi:hypothetical protein PCK1_000953 [Pneumocystis canis]|nr:hypothetical protein PCK1_000953 [Pneumocystis canis]